MRRFTTKTMAGPPGADFREFVSRVPRRTIRETPKAGIGRRRIAGLLCLASLLLSVALVGASWPAGAQETLRAVAVVNDEVISGLDLYMRTRLAILSSGITPTPEARNRLHLPACKNTRRRAGRQLISSSPRPLDP